MQDPPSMDGHQSLRKSLRRRRIDSRKRVSDSNRNRICVDRVVENKEQFKDTTLNPRRIESRECHSQESLKDNLQYKMNGTHLRGYCET